MRDVSSDCRYDADLNLWLQQKEDIYLLGLTDWGQGFLGHISGVDWSLEPGDQVKKGQVVVVLSGDKASIDVHSIVTGKLLYINPRLKASPGLINTSPYQQGWLMALTDLDETHMSDLLSPSEYEAMIDSFFRKGS